MKMKSIFFISIAWETIIQYVHHLKILTNQDMDAMNKEELLEIISKK